MYPRSTNKNPERETFAKKEVVIEIIQKSPYTTIEVIARKYDNSKGVSLVQVMRKRTGGRQYKTLAIPQAVALAIADAITRAAQTLDTM